MTKVLVSDPIDQTGIDILSQVAQVDVRTGLPPEQLKQIIGDYDGLMIRSGTTVTADIIEAATKLRIIGRAGVGVDNVDVPAATKRGVIVVNSPEGNTIAAAEHALALMLSLSRHVPHAHVSTILKFYETYDYNSTSNSKISRALLIGQSQKSLVGAKVSANARVGPAQRRTSKQQSQRDSR